jgi:hypothetical protein
MYVFPHDIFYSVEQLAGLFFLDSKQKYYGFIASEVPTSEVCKDLTTSAIYLSAKVINILGDKFELPDLLGLGKLTVEQVKKGQAKSILNAIEGLTYLPNTDELTLHLKIGAYKPDKRRYFIAKKEQFETSEY